MKGTHLRIIVHELVDWNEGNLFGTIVSDRGGRRLLVEVLKTKDNIAYFKDSESLVQMEFETKVPWTIGKELESDW